MKNRYLKHNLQLQLIPLVALALIVIISFSGCVAVPDQPLVLSGSNDRVINSFSKTCETVGSKYRLDGVNPDGFSVLSWNSHKGSHVDWNEDLRSFGKNADFILLQEAALDDGLKDQLGLLGKEWLLAVAFVYAEQEIGILSAGPVPPRGFCTIREYESLVRIPKIILASTYPIKGFNNELLVINLHMVNFTIGSDAVRRQIEAAREKIKSHQGPVIIAGDFNTWNAERESVVKERMRDLEMQPVSFLPDNRVEFFGRTVDGIYYRGLEVTKARTYQVKSSDHNPLEVHFRLTEAGQI